MVMRKSKLKHVNKARIITYKTSCYQIQIKGPERNEAMRTLFSSLLELLKKGAPLAKADKFGTVIRCISVFEDKAAKTFVLTLIKYNTIKTGLSWNEPKKTLIEDNDTENFSAQKTELIVDVEKHKAYHIHKSHGPSTSQIEEYLYAIFTREKQHQSLDSEIDIIPQKVGTEVEKINQWKSIRKFSIEVIRPNPDGTIKAKQLKKMLEKTSSDKIALDLFAKEKSGLKKSSLTELITASKDLVDKGQGRVKAEGINGNSKSVELDSKDIKVRVEKIKTTEDDVRSLSEIILDYYANNL